MKRQKAQELRKIIIASRVCMLFFPIIHLLYKKKQIMSKVGMLDQTSLGFP